MIPKWFALTAVCTVALFVPSCGHDQQLVSITVQPSGFVFEGVGAQGQFTALGKLYPPPSNQGHHEPSRLENRRCQPCYDYSNGAGDCFKRMRKWRCDCNPLQ
jgi:hypothetical protein